MAWSPEDRRKFLSALDTTESRLLVFYKYPPLFSDRVRHLASGCFSSFSRERCFPRLPSTLRWHSVPDFPCLGGGPTIRSTQQAIARTLRLERSLTGRSEDRDKICQRA